MAAAAAAISVCVLFDSWLLCVHVQGALMWFGGLL
jgi:hypothetical protein